MDKQYSVQFFQTFVDNLQELCKSFLDFNQAVEVSGYMCVEIDNTKKERYVLSELVQSGGNVISESYCTKAFRTPSKPAAPILARQPPRMTQRTKENVNGRMGRPGQPMKQDKRFPARVGQPQNIHVGQHGQRQVPHMQQRPRNFGMRPSDREENIPPHRGGQRRGFPLEDGELRVKVEKDDQYSDDGLVSGPRHKTRFSEEEWEGRDSYVYRQSIERVTNVSQRAGLRSRGRGMPALSLRPHFADDDEELSPGCESESDELSPVQLQQMRQAGNVIEHESEWTGPPQAQPQPQPQHNKGPEGHRHLEEFEIKPDLSLIKEEIEDPEYEASELTAGEFPMDEEFFARDKQGSFPNRPSPKDPASGVVKPSVHQQSPRPTTSGSQIPSQQLRPGVVDEGLLIDEEIDEFVEVDMEEFMDDEDLADINQEMAEEGSEPTSDKEAKKYKSSLKNQRHALKLFNLYQKKRGDGMKPIQTIHPDQLDPLLSDFFLAVRKSNGQEFGPLYLKHIQSHLDQYLQHANYPYSILKDDAFRSSNQVLNDKIGELRARSKRPTGTATAANLSDDDLAVMFEAGELGGCNPDTLLNTLWFVNSYYFGIKQSSDHINLTWGDLKLSRDEDGNEFLECPPGKFKGGKIFADKDDPERCYVRLYKRYRDKRPAHVMGKDGPFYLTPNRITRADNVWYTPERATGPRLNGIFKKVVGICGLKDRKMP